jgi:ATP diphosphatase
MAKESPKEALNRWSALPADKKQLLISNVWCGHCAKAVTICDFSAELLGNGVNLKGFCGTCGTKVARFLEET